MKPAKDNQERSKIEELKKKLKDKKNHRGIIMLLQPETDQEIIKGKALKYLNAAASELLNENESKKNLSDELKEYIEIFKNLFLSDIIKNFNSKKTKETVDRLHGSDFNFSSTDALLADLESLDSESIKELEKSVFEYLEGKNPPKNGDIKSVGVRESMALANYYLLKYGSENNSKINKMKKLGFNPNEYRQDESFKKCVEKIQSASKKTNPFVNSSDPKRYEVQREKYLPAAKDLFVFSIALMMGDFEKENIESAKAILSDYEKMYESGANNQRGGVTRFYHVLTHAALQIMSPQIVDIILRVQKLKDSGKEEDRVLADEIIKDLINNNPQISRRVHHAFIHDLVQPCGPGWQKDAIKILKSEKSNLKLKHIVNANQAICESEQFKELGLGNSKTKAFVNLAAKIFFPGNAGDYDKEKSFSTDPKNKNNKGAAEFLSVIYAYNKETELGREISLAQQIRMCVSLAATIPFEPNKTFFEDGYAKVKDLINRLSGDDKTKILQELEREGLFSGRRYLDTQEKKLNYFTAKMFSEACEMANMDVENFAAKDVLQVYWGSNSVFTEMLGFPNSLSEMPAEQRIMATIMAVKDKRVGIGGRPDGFSLSCVRGGVIFHDFRCEFSELNFPRQHEESIVSMHQRAKSNFDKSIKLHDFDLIDAVFESFNPGFCLDETKLAGMDDKVRLELIGKILDVFDRVDKKPPIEKEKEVLKVYVNAKCKPFEKKINKENKRPMVGAAFYREENQKNLTPKKAVKTDSGAVSSLTNGRGKNK